jgi:RNA polymerase sigma-70 factor (ECF subfamily)
MFHCNPQLSQRFEDAVMAHRRKLSHLAFTLTRDKFRADDLMQDTFLKAYVAFDRFKPGTSCWAWLSRIMVNTFINGYHRAKREVSLEGLSDWENIIDSRGGEVGGLTAPRKELLTKLLRSEVRKAISRLPEKYRQAVIMYDLQGYSYRDMALIMSCSLGTVKSRLFRGRQLLRRDFGGH